MGKLIEHHPKTVGRWIDPAPLEELEPRVFETPVEVYDESGASMTTSFGFEAGGEHGEDMLNYLSSEPGLEIEGGSLTPEGPIILGEVRSCTDCKHRMDPRPWWRRLLFRAEAEIFRCLSATRDEVVNPVTGETNYIDNIFSTPSKGMESPFGKCVDANLYGFCESFEEPS